MNKKGLTIIELLIIVFIISMIAMMSIPCILRARVEATNTKTKAELRTAYTGISMYLLERNEYPKTWEDLRFYLSINKFKNKYELNPNL